MDTVKRPCESVLRRLYEDEKLTTRVIGSRYGVAHISVRRWLAKFGIPIRANGRGLKNRGISEPTKEQLYALIHLEHRSYPQVAELFDVDPSAIRHWLIRHDIPRPKVWDTRRKGREPVLPTEAELHSLYIEQAQSSGAIGLMFDVSPHIVRVLCRKYGIKLRRDGFSGGHRLLCPDGHEVRSTYEKRVCEWLREHGITHEYEPQLPFDRRYHADFLVHGIFIEIWGVTNSRIYKARVKHKRLMYRAHGAALIELPYHAFDTAHKSLWRRRLEPLISNHSQSVESLSQSSFFPHRRQE